MAKENTLHVLFINKLNALLDMEMKLVKALPAMAKAASDPELATGFEDHLEETKMQAEKVKQIIQDLGQKPKPLECDGIKGIIKDAEWVIKHVEEGPALDANLITAAKYAEFYEMAGYEGAIMWAEEMGHDDAAQALQEIYEEEKMADEKLTKLAKNKINSRVDAGMEE